MSLWLAAGPRTLTAEYRTSALGYVMTYYLAAEHLKRLEEEATSKVASIFFDITQILGLEALIAYGRANVCSDNAVKATKSSAGRIRIECLRETGPKTNKPLSLHFHHRNYLEVFAFFLAGSLDYYSCAFRRDS
jgi:hypothetical protein